MCREARIVGIKIRLTTSRRIESPLLFIQRCSSPVPFLLVRPPAPLYCQMTRLKMHSSNVIYISYTGRGPRGSSRTADAVEKHGRGTRMKSGIGRIDSGDKYMRARRLIGGSAARWRGEEREGDSLVVQHGSVGTARWFLRVVSVVGAWPRVCACPSRGRRCRAKVGGGPCYARRGPPRPTSTPRFARSGSTLKRGIYRGDSFRLRSCSPLKENSSSSFLKRTRPPRHKRRASRDEGLSRESNRNPFIPFRREYYLLFIQHLSNTILIPRVFLFVFSFFIRCNYRNSSIDDIYDALSYRFVVFRNVHAHAIRNERMI